MDETADKHQKRIERELLPQLKRVLSRVPFAPDLLAAYYATLDRRTPTRVRLTLIGALIYFLSPFDLMPDFIIGLGFTDDAAVLFATIRSVAGAIEDCHREAAARWLADNGDRNP